MRKGNLIYKKRYFLKEFSGQIFEKTLSKIVPVIQSFNPKDIQFEKVFIDYQPLQNSKFDTLFGRNVKLSVRIYQNPKDITLIIRIYPDSDGKLLLINWNDSTFRTINHFKHILKFKL